jgi:subtilisin-like proprotein convertase family protein
MAGDPYTGPLIVINDDSAVTSTIAVSGIPQGSRVTGVDLFLNGFSHTNPDDVDVLLVSPSGESAIVMSDAGGETDVGPDLFFFSNQSRTKLPDEDPIPGSDIWKPTNYRPSDTFPNVSQIGDPCKSLSVINRTDLNGDWKLVIVDDSLNGNTGSISLGWSLIINGLGDFAEVTVAPPVFVHPTCGHSPGSSVITPHSAEAPPATASSS